jgi:outer membrane protein TolC
MNKVKFLLLYFLLLAGNSNAQGTLTLAEVHEAAALNYPLTKQRSLLQRSGEYSIQNISKAIWPQLTVAGTATYQSEVTKLPISLPGITIPELSKEQYRVYAEAVQPLTDLITIDRQKDVQRAANSMATANLETELYKVKERVNAIYFGTLLLDRQIAQIKLTKADIQTGVNKVSAAVANGTEYRSNLDKLKAEELKADEREIELRHARIAYVKMLELFTGLTLNDTVTLSTPMDITTSTGINRPELRLFQNQEESNKAQSKLLTTKSLPKFALFAQGGAGRPGLNFLDNSLKGYYIGGVRLNWSISNLYTLKKEQRILGINREMTEAQRESFLFNTTISQQQQSADIEKLQLLLAKDEEITALRKRIKTAAQAQLDNGVITVNDYLREVLNEESSRQQEALHEVQLLQSKYQLNYTSGN